MKKIIILIISFFAYLLVLWIQVAVAAGINLAIFGRPSGAITAVLGIISFWTSYKIIKFLRSRFLK